MKKKNTLIDDFLKSLDVEYADKQAAMNVFL